MREGGRPRVGRPDGVLAKGLSMPDYFAGLLASADAADHEGGLYDHLPRAAPPTLLGSRKAPLLYAFALALALLVAVIAVTVPVWNALAVAGLILACAAIAFNLVRLVQSIRVRRDARYPLLPRGRGDADDPMGVDLEGLQAFFAGDPLAVVEAAKDKAVELVVALTRSWRASHKASLVPAVEETVRQRLAPGEQLLIVARASVRPVPVMFIARSRWVAVTDRRVLLFGFRAWGRVGPLLGVFDRAGLDVVEWFKGWASETGSWVLVACTPQGHVLRMAFPVHWRDEAVHVAGLLAQPPAALDPGGGPSGTARPGAVARRSSEDVTTRAV
ncbi:MAG TPA: hypothetical protein VNT51_03840 [Miltoncostaeaceae bacterium]|nr:hypothetical protein [Miltoncostaeaceae bacterium]